MKLFLLALSVAFSVALLSSLASARELALSFDDCPRKAGPVLDPLERDRQLMSALKDAGITAVFFCNSPTNEPQGPARLQLFADHGHLIANHTAHHPDLYKMPVDQFLKNIDQADHELNHFPTFRKWFRFPYLHEGKTPEVVESVRAHLKKTGYINGYVTIDTQDWYVDEVLRQKTAAGLSYHRERLCRTYARMLTDEAQLFDDMAKKALKRDVKHTILLHETDLNAICLKTVIAEFKKKNWSFISPDEAYSDPISKIQPAATSKLNQGRVFALAKEAGYKGPDFTPWIEESAIEQELLKQNVWK